MSGFDKMNKKLLASQVEDALMDDILNKPVPIGENSKKSGIQGHFRGAAGFGNVCYRNRYTGK